MSPEEEKFMKLYCGRCIVEDVLWKMYCGRCIAEDNFKAHKS